MKISGIYKIEHADSGKSYVGSAVNIERRWKEHKTRLNSKTHPNPKLQNAWGKYGEKNFVFSVIEECEIEVLIEKEQNHIDTLKAVSLGYNICGTAGSVLGIKRSEETKLKMSEAQRGRVISDEHKRNISIAMTGKKRSPHSEETIRKIRDSNIGKLHGPQSEEAKNKKSKALKGRIRGPVSEETRRKLSESNSGKTPSLETRLKISESMKLYKSKNT